MAFHRSVAASEVDLYVRISTTATWRGNVISVMGFDHAGDVFIWGKVSRELAQEIGRENDRLDIIGRWQVSGIVGWAELSDVNEEITAIGS